MMFLSNNIVLFFPEKNSILDKIHPKWQEGLILTVSCEVMCLEKNFSRCGYLLKNLDLQIIKCGINYKLRLLESFSTFYA